MNDLPFYTDDPLVDRAAHQLSMHTDEVESARRGYTAMFGSCSCGEWTTPTWDRSAVFEAYDGHMTDVQAATHAALAGRAAQARPGRAGRRAGGARRRRGDGRGDSPGHDGRRAGP